MYGLKAFVMALGVLVISTSIITKVTATVRDTYTNTSSTEYAVADAGVDSFDDLSDWFPILVIVGIGGVVMGMLTFGQAQ